MKKIIFIVISTLLISFLMNFGNNLTYAATIDNTPPKLLSFYLYNDYAIPGERFYFHIDAEDDISGLSSGSIGFHSPVLGYTVYQFDIMNLDFPGIAIPEDAIGGAYEVAHLWLKDKNGNSIIYYNENLFPDEENLFDFGEDKIHIISESYWGEDENPPVLSNVMVDKNRIALGEEVKICVKLSDESEIKYANCEIALKDDFVRSDSKKMIYDAENDLYYAILKPSKTGTHIISEITVIDKYDNDKRYSFNEIEPILENADMSEIEVEGPENDVEPPNLISIELDKQSLVTPGIIKIFAEATDNSDNDLSMLAHFIINPENKEDYKTLTYLNGELAVQLFYDDTLKKYVGTIVLNQYVETGKYYLEYVSVTDSSDNTSQYLSSYFVGNGSGMYTGVLRKKEKIADLSFEIKEEFEYDVSTSTNNYDMIEIIKNQKDDAIIMIDATNDYIIPETVFEAIKGTNKTIYVEVNGYQWVFCGKDITNIKSINVNSYIRLMSDQNISNDSQKCIVIFLTYNEMLPGKAKIRIKTDYVFRNIEDYKEYKIFLYNSLEEKYIDLEKYLVLTEDGFYEFGYVGESIKYSKIKEIVQSEYLYKLIMFGKIILL